MPKYKIVWYDNAGELDDKEIVTFECWQPTDALKAYINAMIKNDGNLVGAKVYPAEDKPLMEVEAQPQKVESKLFGGYDQPVCCGGKKCPSCLPDTAPDRAYFITSDSTWIKKVSWEKRNNSLCVHFLRGGFIVYHSDYLTYENFKMWVDAGGSAGEYYNKNIKGLTVLKRG